MSKNAKKRQSAKKKQVSSTQSKTLIVSKLLQQAQQYQKVGEWQKAEALYYQLLQKNPNHRKALDFYRQLGSALKNKGKVAEAIACYQRALSLNPNDAEMQNSLGSILGSQGKLELAKDCFQKAVALKKNFAEAHYNLGMTLNGVKQFAEAITSFKTAISINPKITDAYINLGNALYAEEKFSDAADSYQKAITLKPNYAIAHSNLGVALNKLDKTTEAIASFQQAIALNPNYLEAHNYLGTTFTEQSEFEKAEDCFKTAISINPNHADAYINLGNAFSAREKYSEAATFYQKAIALNPINYAAEAHNNLGVALQKLDKTREAFDSFQQALVLNPNYIDALLSFGDLLEEQDDLMTAITCYQRALALEPNNADVHGKLAIAFRDIAMINEAITHHKRALEIEPTDWKNHNNLLFVLNYSLEYEQAAIFSEHKWFNEQHAMPLAALIKAHLNVRHFSRRLKIGYVSADFRQHSVAFFIREVLAHHNHEQFEIVCYYNATKIDHITQQLQEYADSWVDCFELSDEKLAEKIRQDQIDILVDLSGHTAGNRLLVFAMKPAPIQVNYLGYPNTTGLTAIDYRITDAYRDPPETSEPFSSESLVRIPGYYCYRPVDDTPELSECPSLQNSYITFGSFNYYSKMNPTVLALWAEVLNAITASKLLLKTKVLADESIQEALKEQFARLGVAPERLILETVSPAPAYLKSYYQVDIGLDTYPYNGGTTTCEALWMGIPVVTLVGKTHASRMGLSILSTIGLTGLIAYTHEEYVDICIKLASNTEYLQQLRAGMRERMQASPLMDYAGLSHQLENEYRKMWEKWCS